MEKEAVMIGGGSYGWLLSWHNPLVEAAVCMVLPFAIPIVLAIYSILLFVRWIRSAEDPSV